MRCSLTFRGYRLEMSLSRVLSIEEMWAEENREQAARNAALGDEFVRLIASVHDNPDVAMFADPPPK